MRIPEHIVAPLRDLAVISRAEIRHQLWLRKDIFGVDHPDTVALRRRLAVIDEACIALGADSDRVAA